MFKEDIYIGTIKKCLDIDKYDKYGERFFHPDFRIRSMTFGTEMPTVVIESTQEVLIKTEHGYLRASDISGLFVNFRLAYEFYDNLIFNMPYNNGDLFVDEATLVPFYPKKGSDKIKTKKLKKDINKIDNLNKTDI